MRRVAPKADGFLTGVDFSQEVFVKLIVFFSEQSSVGTVVFGREALNLKLAMFRSRMASAPGAGGSGHRRLRDVSGAPLAFG